MKPLVSIAGGEGPYKNILKSLSPLDLSVLKGKKVLIKPNCGRIAKEGSGINTHPQAVAAVIDALHNAGASFVAIGEGTILGVNTIEAFEASGIASVAKERNALLIDLDKRSPVVQQVPAGILLDSLKLCRDIFDFDYCVSVPVAKMHMHTVVSLSIKNMKGCLRGREKVRLHQLQYRKGKEYQHKTLDIAISDLASILLPHIAVIDGFVGLEGMGPSAGEPIQSDFALASFNALAADMVCCELMGLDPLEVPHLQLIRNRKIVDPFDFDSISILPDKYICYRHVYKRPPKTFCIDFPNIEVHDKESCSACLSTLLLFLKRYADELDSYSLKDGKIHLAIGKSPENIPDGTILIGNCTAQLKKRGIFISGCPPVSSRILKILKGS
ncbi:MAG: DUF362 domain-containing protein [bacterium]